MPEAVKHERFNRLVDKINEVAAAKNQACEGKLLSVLVEGPSKTNSKTYTGRTESSKIVNFKGLPNWQGQIVPVRITEGKTFSLTGNIER